MYSYDESYNLLLDAYDESKRLDDEYDFLIRNTGYVYRQALKEEDRIIFEMLYDAFKRQRKLFVRTWGTTEELKERIDREDFEQRCAESQGL